MTAQFSNGLSQNVYKIPIATFTNPDGLGQVSGNAYVADAIIPARPTSTWPMPARAGAHPVQSLEGSTVDLATEFTNLITTQRAYSRMRPASSPPPTRCCRTGTVADR